VDSAGLADAMEGSDGPTAECGKKLVNNSNEKNNNQKKN